MLSKEDLEIRKNYITSSEIGALFHCHPFKTYAQIWLEKKHGKLFDEFSSEEAKWGQRMEEPIANGLAEDYGWKIKKKDDFAVLETEKIGSHFDYEFVDQKTLLEIKTVGREIFSGKWSVFGDHIEAPFYLELQAQVELMCSKYDNLYFGILVGGNKPEKIFRENDPIVQDAIKERVGQFWESLKLEKMPEFAFPDDNELIKKIYSVSIPGKFLSISENHPIFSLAQEYQMAREAEKNSAEIKENLKSKLLIQMGDYEKIEGPGLNISAKVIPEKEIESYTRSQYRHFSLQFKGK